MNCVFEENGSFSLNALVHSLEDCPCGRTHTADVKDVRIGEGLAEYAGDILAENGFPKSLLVTADKNTVNAAGEVLPSLERAGYKYELVLYDDLRTAEMEQVEYIGKKLTDYEGCLSIGTGSLNDISRLASFRQNRAFAIFATAPSMDGFASDSAPITTNNFKVSHPARQPSVIIADTRILAKAPAVLKGAGFGDMIGKLTALVDWRISTLLTKEHYCENVAGVTAEALRRMLALAPHVGEDDPKTAGEIMKALVLTGVAMKLEGSVRPASGTEHIISHFWEIKKLEQGMLSDFHGRKVGVATVITTGIYNKLAQLKSVSAHRENVDWDKVYKAYGPAFSGDVKRLNSPPVTDETTPERIEQGWSEICRIVNEQLPTKEELIRIMKSAGAPVSIDEIEVVPELGRLGVEYHPYMRHRMTLMRLLPMIDVDINDCITEL